MWTREVVGQQVYLNTQDAVYEVLTKTPEQVLCKRADAVKIDMMIKQSLTAEPDPQYNVRLVPYLNVATDTVIDPNSAKNYSRNVALAIAFIANDRSDWTRFIPVGIKARELSAKKRREAEIVSRQSEPFKSKQRLADGDSDSEEFQLCDNANRNSDSGGDSDSGSENGRRANYNSDDDVDDKVAVYNAKTKKFEKASPEERREFVSQIGGSMFAPPPPLLATMVEAAEQASAAKDGSAAATAAAAATTTGVPQLAQRKSADAGGSASGAAKINLAEEKRAADALYERVARLQKERERQIDSTLPSDRVRRQAASLSDPTCEPILSELAQCHHANVNDAAKFDVAQQRQATRDKDCGIADSSAPTEARNVLDRFAPAKSGAEQPANVPLSAAAAATATATATTTATAVAATAPKYTLQQLMQYGAQTKLPPSIQQQLDQKKAMQKGAEEATLPAQQQQQQPKQQPAADNSRLIGEKCKAIRRKQLELMQLHAELEDLLKLPL